ncbi:hypothetical protein BS47DRAFT_1483046 [Hydnum rufescens UP504]|uniref:Uncharacterized protein n=1 Tax=Hydnum rufescens UP504 TaxID=1448309 RepID=A0A9P6B7R9_9AGAM|nr:hypothetical protein BS47DRAFT_1483046 [Hydnum rufescens UP504]
MSYRIAGRLIKNEYLAIGVLTSTAAIAYASLGGGSKKAVATDKAGSIVDSVKGTFKSDDEEAFVREFIAKAEKEEAKH